MLSSFLGSFSFLSFLLKPSIFIVQMATLTKRWGKIWPEVHWWCEMKSNYAVQWLARSHDVSSVNLENLHTTERKLHSQVHIVICCIRLRLIGLALGQSARPRYGPKPITKFTLRHHHPPSTTHHPPPTTTGTF